MTQKKNWVNRRATALFLAICFLSLSLSACASRPSETPPRETTPEETPDGGNETETTEEPSKPDPPKKQVAFTFDDGPSRQWLTYKIVDEFAKYDGKCTFFVIGNLIYDSTGEEMAYAAARGCEFGVHAYTHELYFDRCSMEEFLNEVHKTEEAIRKYVPEGARFMRAPGGSLPADRAKAVGYANIFWSVDSEGWRYKSCSTDEIEEQNIETIVNNVLSTVSDGDIVLMHEIYSNSCRALCRILAELDARGYEFVTVTELLGAVEPGVTYSGKP